MGFGRFGDRSLHLPFKIFKGYNLQSNVQKLTEFFVYESLADDTYGLFLFLFFLMHDILIFNGVTEQLNLQSNSLYVLK